MICIGMMVWVKLRKKYYQHVWILWRVAHFVSITLISNPDQNFSAGIRRVLKRHFYFFLVLSLIGQMVNFSLDLYVWNIERYEIVHFCIPKFKIKNVKSKWHWKESESEANAVSTRVHWEICSKTGTEQTFIGSVDVSTFKNYWIHTFQWSIYQGFVFWRKIQGSIVSKGTAMN